MQCNCQTKKYVWKGFLFFNEIIRNYINQISNGGNILNPEEEKNIKEEQQKIFIQRLQELFIGCDIIIDPLQTYLIIDWS